VERVKREWNFPPKLFNVIGRKVAKKALYNIFLEWVI
jgi:hypothetical protein